jgi:EAL domain-containing protein (putative c-di-GMP-specific phosphodiesterase class I)
MTRLDRPELSAAAALLEADLAMAEAKRLGRNRAMLHDPRLLAGTLAVHEWADRIREAVETDGFALHAQRVRGLHGNADQWELLVRLPIEDGELLPPDRFLPIAQQFGLGPKIDEWVSRRAIEMIADQQSLGEMVRLEVNIGEDTLGDAAFVEGVEAAVAASGIDPSALVFEVSASTVEVNLEDGKVLSERLKARGCMFAIDSFGANAGALEQLRVLPVDFVKIDASFIRHLPGSPVDRSIVRSLTDLAHSLGCKVIAMAVGDDETVSLLDDFGVDFVQGFHIERPIPLTKQ